MTEQITIDHDFIYEPLIDTYMVDIVTESGFKLEFCEAETKEEAALKIREKYRKNYSFKIRSIEDFILPDHVSENQMNIIIARVESRSDCADDVVHLLQKEIPGLKVRKVEETDLNFDDAEIVGYDIREN